ncbi:MAG: ABC transporter ATP-binding protein [bacterium]
MNTKQNDNIILFEHVSKRYDDLAALDNVSFQISHGEIFGYIGPNGAGKTTTIKILVGLIRDFKGRYCFGNNIMPDNIVNLHQMLGYLPQDVAFQEWRTVDHALQTFGRLSGLNNPELENRIKDVLVLFDLTEERHKKIVKLSGGMIQKLGLAQALLHRPQLLILDEPLSGLDPISRYKVKTMLKDLAKDGTTIFFSSHILSDVQDIATKIAIINKGRLLKVGSLQDLKSDFLTPNEIEIELANHTQEWKKLHTLTGIKEISQPVPHKLLVSLDDNCNMDDICHGILKTLVELNCPIRCFKPVESNLDELYLKYIESDEIS